RGGEDRTVTLNLSETTRETRALDLWAERWTARGGFSFRIEMSKDGRWSEVKRQDSVKIGGFETRISAEIPAGVSALRFVCGSEGGVLIDDLTLTRSGPMSVVGIDTTQPVVPVLRRKAVNPVLGFTLSTDGNEKPVTLEAVELSLKGTTRMQDILRID